MSGPTQTTPETARDVAVLSTLLHEELAVLQKMTELAQSQRSILASRQPDAVWDNLSEVEASWQTLHVLEGRREVTAGRVAQALGLSDEKTTLAHLVPVLSADAGEALKELHTSLVEMTQEVAQLNAQNGALIQGLLFLTGHQLQFFTALGHGFQPYNASGQKTGGPAPIARPRRLA